MGSVENRLLVELVDTDFEYFKKKLMDALKYELPQNYLHAESMVRKATKEFIEEVDVIRKKHNQQNETI